MLKSNKWAKLGVKQRSKLATVMAAKAATMAKGEEDFTLNQVKGDLKMTKALTLAPFENTHVMTQSRVKGHRKRVSVLLNLQIKILHLIL